METLVKSNVKVGILRTQLGVEGYEEEGPLIAAKELLKFLKG